MRKIIKEIETSPWGDVDSCEEIVPGVFNVFTPSHGGYMVRKNIALRHLSFAARSKGTVWGNFLTYEEDCRWAILAWERPEWFAKSQPWAFDGLKKEALRIIKLYDADYFDTTNGGLYELAKETPVDSLKNVTR